MSITLVMPSKHLILCCLLLLPPTIFLNIRVFSKESALHIRCPKYWSLNFSISPLNESLGLFSFRISLQSKRFSRVSPTPQSKRINYSALSFLYSPTLTRIHDYWKSHSFDEMDLLVKQYLFFLICCLGWS